MKITDLSTESPTQRATPNLPRSRQRMKIHKDGVEVENEAAEGATSTQAFTLLFLVLGASLGATVCAGCAWVAGLAGVTIGLSGFVAFFVLLLTGCLLLLRRRP